MPNLVSDADIEKFNESRDILLTDDGGKGKVAIWEKDSCKAFNIKFNNYNQYKTQGDINKARVSLSFAVAEFQEINDEPLYYDFDLISKVRSIAETLKKEVNYIIKNIETIPSTPDELINRRMKLTFESKYLTETIKLCNLAEKVHTDKKFYERLCNYASEHPVIVSIGGVVVGIGLGACIIYLAPAALAGLGIVIEKGGKLAVGINVVSALALIGTVIADGVIVYNAKAFSESIKLKRIYKANREVLVRYDVELKEERVQELQLEPEVPTSVPFRVQVMN